MKIFVRIHNENTNHICLNGTSFWNDNWNGFPVKDLPQVVKTAMPNTFITIRLERNSVPVRQNLKNKKECLNKQSAWCLSTHGHTYLIFLLTTIYIFPTDSFWCFMLVIVFFITIFQIVSQVYYVIYNQNHDLWSK